MNIKLLSNTFYVRRLSIEDADLIYNLSCKNKIFYQFHPPFVTRESIQEDIRALPAGKDYNDKYYIGFFEKETLVAIMDLILDYPTKDTAFIGLFMMDFEYQNKNIGSKIISECAKYLKILGFHKIRLGVDKENPQSNAFWKKNSFVVADESEYILMELAL
ncbi:MAG: GNAT family N-acetyltransferase [Lachnospiraceae bacterium]|nr:GNAT family N-acetyltransferase [Lachnospiraceae bacterium]MBD5488585.1 GNAT family N-acetyltransferase [Lachnospiraceae bacterium]